MVGWEFQEEIKTNKKNKEKNELKWWLYVANGNVPLKECFSIKFLKTGFSTLTWRFWYNTCQSGHSIPGMTFKCAADGNQNWLEAFEDTCCD